MRNPKNILIEELVVHSLDSQNNTLLLSDYPIQLSNSPDIVEYFIRHIRDSLFDPITKAARFRNIIPNQASGICNDILSGRSSLLEGSKILAELIFNIMERDRRISPADLAICLYIDPEVLDNRFLAILLMDRSPVFEHKITRDESGNVKININQVTNVFTQERLRKSAFIRTLEPRNPDYDMLLLDRQSGGQNEISKYFAKNFLDAEEAYDASARTKLLYRTLLEVRNQLQSSLPEDIKLELDQRIRAAVTNRSINTDRWVDELPIDENLTNLFREQLSLKLPDIEFDLDPQFAASMTKKRNFEGDYDLRLSISSEYYSNVVQSVTKFTTPDGEIRVRVVIETREWKEVGK
jgi:hypothetical protein